jgi:hypothetical protein
MDYVVTISTRDHEHPLADAMLIEAGADNAKEFVEAFWQLAELLRIKKTPEKVAEFMKHNMFLADASCRRQRK